MHTIRWGRLNNSVTLKSMVSGNGTIGHIIYDLLLLDLFDVELACYRLLELRVRGHWRLFKLAPFESMYTVSYSHSVATMAVSLAIWDIFSIKEWVWGRSRSLKMAQFDAPYYFLLVGPCNYSSILTIFFSYLALNNIVTLKSGLHVIHDHWNWYHSKAWVWFRVPIT